MYLATRQPVKVWRRRRTLGDWGPFTWRNPFSGDFWSWGSATDYGSPAWYWDIVPRAITGHPTDAQIAINTNDCVTAVQNMPGLTPEARATAQNQCATDQQAYTKLIGGTAQQVLSPANLLSGVLPNGGISGGISTAAWLILASVVGLIVLTRR